MTITSQVSWGCSIAFIFRNVGSMTAFCVLVVKCLRVVQFVKSGPVPFKTTDFDLLKAVWVFMTLWTILCCCLILMYPPTVVVIDNNLWLPSEKSGMCVSYGSRVLSSITSFIIAVGTASCFYVRDLPSPFNQQPHLLRLVAVWCLTDVATQTVAVVIPSPCLNYWLQCTATWLAAATVFSLFIPKLILIMNVLALT